jgi:alkylated DNA repair dioxygenase AlkB
MSTPQELRPARPRAWFAGCDSQRTGAAQCGLRSRRPAAIIDQLIADGYGLVGGVGHAGGHGVCDFPDTTEDMGSSPSAPAVAWQPSLWVDQNTVVDGSFCGLERVQLDSESWVDHCPRWMSGSDQAFEELLRDVAWSRRRRWMYERKVDEPRLTSWQTLDDPTSVTYEWLEDARASLSTLYEVRFDSVGINLYRDGADSVAWHRDRIPPEIANPVVALVSLGEPRTFLLRPRGGGKSCAFKLGRGDLLVTGGQTQRRFEHSVPKVKAAAARVSIAFRHGVG